MFRKESRVAKCLEKGNWKEDETNLTSSNVYNTRVIEFRSFRNLRNLPGVTGSRDTQREEEPLSLRAEIRRGRCRYEEMGERMRGNLMIARWIYGEMMDGARRVGRRRGRVCVVSIPRSGPASIDHLGLL